MSKKLLALLLALVMIVGSFTSVLAATETKTEEKKETVEEKKDEKSEEKKDEKSEEKKEEKTEEKTEEKKEEEPVKTDNPALTEAIAVLKKAGFISGYSKDSDDFKVEKNVTRAEFASMIVRALGLEESAKSLATLPTGFKDVPANLWANGYIAVAKQQGIVNGYPNGTFQPNRQISYQDMATMLTIALGKQEAGTVYPAGYIVKAQQLGLFKNVDVPAYTDMATRGNVFIMLHNMITSKEFGQRKIVKAIVLENSRVEKLAADEVTVEVISLVQKANWVDGNRDKRGDQHTYKLDKDLKLDTEDLLGKVVDLTITKDDKIVAVKEDDSYKVLSGEITSVDYKKIGIDGTKYTALLDERYASEDERLYRTYVNNRDFKYEDFARKYENETYNFARVTVKNGKAIFIDAYKFYDIAPVAEVKDGAVWYYDDARSAAIVRANKLTTVVFNTNKGYSTGSVKEVTKDDVIHLFKDWRDNYGFTHAIVKKDARIDTELTKTHLDANGETAVTKDDAYWFNTNSPFRPIYSYEGKQFEVATSRKLLEPIVGRKVKMLVAIDGSLQLIESDLQWNDGVNAIMRITSSGDVQYLPSTGAPFWAKEGRNTKYYTMKMDNNKQLSQLFGINDVVYYAGEGSEKDQAINKMVNILKYLPQYEDSKINKIIPVRFAGIKYDYNFKQFNETVFNFMPAKMNGRYISINDQTVVDNNWDNYRYFEGLHAYFLDKNNNLRQVGDLSKFIVDNAKNTELKAIVYSEGQLKALLEGYYEIDTYNFLSSSDTIANTVIFKDAKVTANSDVVFAEVVAKDGWTNTVFFKDAQGKEYTVKLNDEFGVGRKHTQYGIKDIVKLHILKATADKDVKEGYVEEVAIRWGAPKVFVSEIKGFRSYNIDGEEKFFDKDTQIFNRLAGDYAQVYYESQDDPKDGDPDVVRVIRYFEKPDAVETVIDGTVNAAGTSDFFFAYVDNNNKAQKARLELYTQLVYNKKVQATGGKDIDAAIGNVGSMFDGADVKLTFDRDGKLLVITIVETLGEKLDKAEAALAKLDLSKLSNSLYAVTNPKKDQKAMIEKEIMDKVDALLNAAKAEGKVDAKVTYNVDVMELTVGSEQYVETAAPNDGNGKVEITLIASTKTRKLALNKFHVLTPAEVAAAQAAEKAAADKKANDEAVARLKDGLAGVVQIKYTEAELQKAITDGTAADEAAYIKKLIEDKIKAVAAVTGTTALSAISPALNADNTAYETTVTVTTGATTETTPKFAFNVVKAN